MDGISMNTKHVLTFFTGAALGAFGWNQWLKRKARMAATPAVATSTAATVTLPATRQPTSGQI